MPDPAPPDEPSQRPEPQSGPARDTPLPDAMRPPFGAWLLAEKRTRYRLTRFAILRLLGLVYAMGFLVLARQGLSLIGHDGLLPADRYIEVILRHFPSRGSAFWEAPTLFLWSYSDTLFLGLAWLGVGLSLLVLLGFANAFVLAVLWALYLSFVHIGQLWYGYGWEIQLLETGFLAIFLAAPLDPRPFAKTDPPQPVVWLLRWLTFRIMLGAGLIKIRGDTCWRDLSCLDFHYETQPIPSPLSPLFHFSPHALHVLGALFNHLCELVVPFLVFGSRRARHLAGVLLVVFQGLLIASGNLSFLNWLTLVPILACFDDSFFERLVPSRWRARFDAIGGLHAPPSPPGRGQRVAVWALVALVFGLSLGPVANMLSSEQVMNTSFNAFALVNTYGAFGSVGRERDEIVFEGTAEEAIGEATVWKPYEFRCKPGDPDRAPCWMSPYHDRLDWQIWFAAMGSPEDAPWTLHFAWKLLQGDRGVIGLLANDPFPGKRPRHIRATLYRYRFAPLFESGWWRRERLGAWLPPLSAEDPRLLEMLATYGWR